GTQVLLDAVNSAGIDQLIHISTSEVYGTSQQHLMNEDHLLNPRSPYAAAKTGAERLAYSYWATFQTPVTIVRPFNNYGPHQHLEKLIPCFITSALRGETLPMHGTGKSTRDWIFVEDTCRGVDAILRAPREDTIGEVFNLGTGVDTSVLSITEQLLDTLGKPRDLIQPVAERPGQVDRHCADYAKVKAVCGWEPQVTIDEGLRRTVQWYVDNRDWWDAPETNGRGQRPWWDIEGISEASEQGQLGRLIEQAKR
ncbi:MAG: GDP-mannose 4,6-dehydratase, partial [Actinomycetota bacterium]